jgi:hypothetical protein
MDREDSIVRRIVTRNPVRQLRGWIGVLAIAFLKRSFLNERDHQLRRCYRNGTLNRQVLELCVSQGFASTFMGQSMEVEQRQMAWYDALEAVLTV